MIFFFFNLQYFLRIVSSLYKYLLKVLFFICASTNRSSLAKWNDFVWDGAQQQIDCGINSVSRHCGGGGGQGGGGGRGGGGGGQRR